MQAAGIAEAAEDRCGGDLGDAGRGGHAAARVGLLKQERGALVEVFQFLGQVQRQTRLNGDVIGEIGVIQFGARPQLKGLGSGS